MKLKLDQLTSKPVLIVVVILLVASVYGWQQSREAEIQQAYFLDGIRSDLVNDITDLNLAIVAARQRAAAADEILVKLVDPERGHLKGIAENIDLAPLFNEVRMVHRFGSIPLGQTTVLMGNLQRFNPAPVTFSEVMAGGKLEVIQDTGLRANISAYYINAIPKAEPTDERVYGNATDFQQALAEVGLNLRTNFSDKAVLEAFQNNPQLTARLRNFRELAVLQLGYHTRLLDDAQAIVVQLDQWSGTHS